MILHFLKSIRLSCFFGWLCIHGVLLAGDIEIDINEVYYHPADGSREGEFIEFYNYGEDAIDMSHWELKGAVRLRFPQGLVLEPDQYLLAVSDADLILNRYDLPLETIGGVYLGSLDNNGERLELWNDKGYLISSVHYNDAGAWPEEADGLGPSLERIAPRLEDDDPYAWALSNQVGGTPASANSIIRPEPGEMTHETVFTANSDWAYFKGTEAPPEGWDEPGFNDAQWERGEAGFGYSDNDDNTVLDDMRDNYVSLFIRREIELVDVESITGMDLIIDYDDGFRVTINGIPVGARNLTNPAFDQPTPQSHEAGVPETIPLDYLSVKDFLVEGTNVIGVQGNNSRIDSADFSLHPMELIVARQVANEGEPVLNPNPAPRDLVINELFLGSGATGWVEFYNATDEEIDLGGRKFQVFPETAGLFVFPEGLTLDAKSHLVLTEGEIGFEFENVHAVILATSDNRFIDGFNPRTVRPTESVGRFPDGNDSRWVFTEPSEGTANELPTLPKIVINEIQYHPSDDNLGGEYLEIFNNDEQTVNLTGWSFTQGISFDFPQDTTIEAGAFLIIARDPFAFTDFHGIENGVLGPYEGRLRNDAETIVLRDDHSNRIDRVQFADEGSWPEDADGLGPSVELIHPDLYNRHGSAWAVSDEGGTPGAVNSRFQEQPAPIAARVRHFPVVPTPAENVQVQVVLSDDDPLDSARLFYQAFGQGGVVERTLLDDGINDDGVAGNGVFGAEIPNQANRTIVGFWIEVEDEDGQVTTVPQGAPEPTFLYQVETPRALDTIRPLYRFVMRPDVLNQFENRNRGSDVLLDLTFIAHGKAYYNRGIRLRGNSARSCNPLSYRIQFDHDNDFDGIKRLNMNGCNAYRQWSGLDFLRRTTIPTPQSWFRTISFNGDLDSRLRLRVESVDAHFLERALPGDDDGNLYRGERRANLDYRGEDFGSYRNDYAKVTNEDEDDYSDVVNLCTAFDSQTTSDEDFPAAMEATIDTDQWALYFAAYAILGSTENSIVLNNGDDYYLYHRFSDNRWILLPWDLDSCFDERDQVLFRPTVDQIERFLEHPLYAPSYWCHLENLLESSFQAENTLLRLDQLNGLFPDNNVNTLRNFVQPRIDYISQRVTDEVNFISTFNSSFCDGSLLALSDPFEVAGRAPTCGTNTVLVNGEEASFDPQTARWSLQIPFVDGSNVEVIALNSDGEEIDRTETTMRSGSSSNSFIPLDININSNRELDNTEQFYRVRNNTRIFPGVTLTLKPGVVLGFDNDATLTVQGNLVIEGTEEQPVTFQSDDCGERWEGVIFESSSQNNQISYLRFREASRPEFVGGAPIVIRGGDVEMDNFSFDANTNSDGPAIRVMDNGSLRLSNSTFQAGTGALVFQSSNGLIDACQFKAISGTALDLAGSGVDSLTVQNSIFENCSVGIQTDSMEALIHHSTFYACGTGLDISGTGPEVVQAHSLIVWESENSAVRVAQSANLDLSFSNTSGGVLPGESNLSQDPLFVDPLASDFSLMVRSPSRASGLEGSDMGAIPYQSTGLTNTFLRCDSNGDGLNDLGDAVSALVFLFIGDPVPVCMEAVDCNSDSKLDLTDAIFNLTFQFLSGDPPSDPFPACDSAPEEDCFETICL